MIGKPVAGMTPTKSRSSASRSRPGCGRPRPNPRPRCRSSGRRPSARQHAEKGRARVPVWCSAPLSASRGDAPAVNLARSVPGVARPGRNAYRAERTGSDQSNRSGSFRSGFYVDRHGNRRTGWRHVVRSGRHLCGLTARRGRCARLREVCGRPERRLLPSARLSRAGLWLAHTEHMAMRPWDMATPTRSSLTDHTDRNSAGLLGPFSRSRARSLRACAALIVARLSLFCVPTAGRKEKGSLSGPFEYPNPRCG